MNYEKKLVSMAVVAGILTACVSPSSNRIETKDDVNNVNKEERSELIWHILDENGEETKTITDDAVIDVFEKLVKLFDSSGSNDESGVYVVEGDLEIACDVDMKYGSMNMNYTQEKRKIPGSEQSENAYYVEWYDGNAMHYFMLKENSDSAKVMDELVTQIKNAK